MIVTLEVFCAHCDNPIRQKSLHVGEDESNVVVNVMSFTQTSWQCDSCDHVSSIGDIDCIDAEDL